MMETEILGRYWDRAGTVCQAALATVEGLGRVPRSDRIGAGC